MTKTKRKRTDAQRAASAKKRAIENARRQKDDRRLAQDIAPLPKMHGRYKRMRLTADMNLLGFLQTCFPNAFDMPFSPDHLQLIDDIDRACTSGLLKALAMPRGSGKTTILVRAAIWAIVSGRRRYAAIVGATADAAVGLLESIKTEVLHNPMLRKLYPAELHCVHRLEGESRLQRGQRFNGELTGVEWRADRIKFGFVSGLEVTGGAIATCGLTGNIRGLQETLPSGEVMRPDVLLVDDWQTHESAKKPAQCAERLAIINGDCLGLAGPQRQMSALVTGTVLYANDGMDQLLDKRRNPMWNGTRCSMVYEWPTDETGWDEYRQIYENDLAAGGDGSAATEWAKRNHKWLHAGSRVGWEHRKGTCRTALEYAYRLRFRDEVAFFSEYQNQPLTGGVEMPFTIDAVEVALRTTSCPKWEVPDQCERITAFIDVQKHVLFFKCMAWELGGRGHVIGYGTWPDQRTTYFTKAHLRQTIQMHTAGSTLEEQLYEALTQLTADLFSRRFRVQGFKRGEMVMSLDRCGIDGKWGYSTDTVRRFCTESEYMGRVHPMMGQYIGADSKPWQRWSHHKTDLLGMHCKMIAPPKGKRGVRELLVDTNWWKSYAADRITNLPGSASSIQLHAGTAAQHRLVGEHYASETPELVKGKHRECIEWGDPPTGVDNDFWDCLVGNCVLSGMVGVRIHDPTRSQTPNKKATDNGQKETDAPKQETDPPKRKKRRRITDATW